MRGELKERDKGRVIRRGIRVGEEGEGEGSSSASPGGKREPRADKPQARKPGNERGCQAMVSNIVGANSLCQAGTTPGGGLRYPRTLHWFRPENDLWQNTNRFAHQTAPGCLSNPSARSRPDAEG